MKPYSGILQERKSFAARCEERLLDAQQPSLDAFASGHEYYGLHQKNKGWVFREWAPNATDLFIIGDFSAWLPSEQYRLQRISDNGTWEITLPADAIKHNDLYRLHIIWNSGSGDRIPAYARRVVQDSHTHIFSAQVWAPESSYEWKNSPEPKDVAPIIYEAHVGMAQESPGLGTYSEFRRHILPRILDAGYNTVQLMAIMEHPYYGSFGYHVANFFAASSRFGTPEDLKMLIDDAHGMGLRVIIDLVHSHAVRNEAEGLSRFDGTLYQYFHEGTRGNHDAWDSRCFNYGKPEVLHFLLSNCRFWLDEYRIDGFRFDGITSMLYHHHGIGPSFDSYERYFDDSVDEEAIAYLALANKLIHAVRPDAITIAEDVSGMPGLAAPDDAGGCGFDYRLAMGVPDCLFKLVNDTRDEDWNMDYLWRELTNRRSDEKTISYTECHDQSLVGGKTLIFELIDSEMYDAMDVNKESVTVDRGMALHKMIRLATLFTAGHGYLNFMGNEFGHPEWIDFPREGNNWSYHYARRQWSLRDNNQLRYHFLADFDRVIINLASSTGLLAGSAPVKLVSDNDDKVLVFARDETLFLFNFHPHRSFDNYAFEAPVGEYQLMFNTDEARFGGHSRVVPEQEYICLPVRESGEIRYKLSTYLPSRTALVLERRRHPKR